MIIITYVFSEKWHIKGQFSEREQLCAWKVKIRNHRHKKSKKKDIKEELAYNAHGETLPV